MKTTHIALILAVFLLAPGIKTLSQSALDINAYGVWSKDTEFDPSDPNYDYLLGMSVEGGQWSQIQPDDSSTYDWSTIQQSIDVAAERGQFIYLGIGIGPESPAWVYENGVPKVYTDDTDHPGWKFYPYYMDPDYIRYVHTFIKALADFLYSQPEEKLHWVSFLQVKTGCTGDEVAYKGTPLDLQYDIPKSGQKWQDFRLGVFETYRESFLTGQHKIPLLFNAIRAEDYPIEWNWIIDNIGSGFGIKEGALVRGHHLTGERIVVETWHPHLVNPKGLALFTRSEMDQTWKQPLYQLNLELGFYWGILNGLNQGLSLNDVSTSALREIKNNTTIQNAYRFLNKYANQIYPESSSRAFIALHEGLDASNTNKFPESKYGEASQKNQSRYAAICNDPVYKARGARMDDLNGATLGQVRQRDSQLGYNDAGWEIWPTNYSRFITQIDPKNTSIGLFRIGGPLHPNSPVYSRFARGFENSTGKNAMYFQLHEDLFDATADTVTFIVRYYDKDNGSSWSFAYDAGDAELKEAFSVTCNGSGTWKTQTVTVPDAVLNQNGPMGSDFALLNTDGKDDIFHMIEVEKGMALPIRKKANNAFLESLTWPDIPDSISSALNWTNKILPGFSSDIFSYEISLPNGSRQIPALVATAKEVNASIVTERATNLSGSIEERTSTFIVTAEDEATTRTYKVTFSISGGGAFGISQPYFAEPLFTRFVYREWFNNNYIEISNPGTDTLDLSQYLVAIGDTKTPEKIISDTLSFPNRYNYYIPGRDYSTDDSLLYDPGKVIEDPLVNSMIEPGGSFVIGHIERTDMADNIHINDCDIIINREFSFETEVKLIVPGPNTLMKNGWMSGALCLYKIVNDSVRNGKKVISDPDDFELIDVFGTFDGSDWAPDGASLLAEDNKWNLTRKPEFWKGNTLPGLSGSWGSTKEESEWICNSKADYQALGLSPGDSQLKLSEEIGNHIFDPITAFTSTITSNVYSVSAGYETPQEISGISMNTSFEGVLANIIKRHPNQTIVLTGSDGTPKELADIIAEGDTITVTSAEGQNITNYGLHTRQAEQSSDAVLKVVDGSGYMESHSGSSGTISGIPSNISLSQVLANMIVPDKARLQVLDSDNNLVPLLTLNAAGSYIHTSAYEPLFIEVTAEDNLTRITYQLEFIANESEAFAWSDVYQVDQEKSTVTQVPAAVNVSTLFRNLRPNIGSTMKLLDRAGVERWQGPVDLEDYVLVSSADGSKEKIYQLNFNGEFLGNEAFITSDTFDIKQETFTIDSVLLNTPVDLFLDNINVSPYASMEIIDISMSPMPSTTLDWRHSVVVTSGDGETSNIYQFNFYDITLGTEAYITSNTYYINQETFAIDSMSIEITISEFLSNIIAPEGATIKILDENQTIVNSGNLNEGYTVVVTSGDENTTVIYSIHFYHPDKVERFESSGIHIYPNPTNDQLTIDGLAAYNSLKILSLYGSTIRVIQNIHSEEINLSINDLKPGIYFIQITHNNFGTITSKIIKK
ncbi:T9SS type A sorting domain-containing protein [Bacteroidota bacterium]